jgi:hypothetical protein
MIPRALMEADPVSFFRWAAFAAGLFLSATVVWFVYLVPKLVKRS